MIDLGLFRDDPKKTMRLIKEKDPTYNGQRLFDLDLLIRRDRSVIESLRHQKNELATEAQSGITGTIRNSSVELGKQIKQKKLELSVLELEFKELYLSCPNIPDSSIPVGGKEKNRIIKVVGDCPSFAFSVKNHLELGIKLGWFDLKAASTMTGSNFIVYKNDAVRLMYALSMFMLHNNMKHGYAPILPPYLINEKSLEVAGNFPKFREQVYAVPEDALYLTPTAEVNLSNLYRDTIIPGSDLPKRMTSLTSCFRREVGGYGATERGLIRIHQFEKIELYTLCKPENAYNEQERMLACAEDIIKQLGLHYRITLLATKDCSFSSAKTYDIEVWLPGQNEYYEVSSVSLCTDFQARRGQIRYRTTDKKNKFVYTLNGSSLALSRLMVALMETYQYKDGSIHFPSFLKNWGAW